MRKRGQREGERAEKNADRLHNTGKIGQWGKIHGRLLCSTSRKEPSAKVEEAGTTR